MRVVPTIDQECADMFGLDAHGMADARHILSAMGRDTLERQSRHALNRPENRVHAAMWAALHAPYPWPWLAAELASGMVRAAEEEGGGKLFCAILARHGQSNTTDCLSTPAAIDACVCLGVICSARMCCPSDLTFLSTHKRRDLARSLASGTCLGLPPRAELQALAVWAMPLLYTPKNFGPYDSMDDSDRALLARSLADLLTEAFDQEANDAPRDILLGLGPMDSILRESPCLAAPLSFRVRLDRLASSLILHPSDIACSVSFHKEDDREWLRVALRPSATGFCLSGMDWPAMPGQSKEAFDRLLDTLGSCGVDSCHQVEGSFNASLCPQCGEPVYPMPRHEPWRLASMEAGVPLDGSHLH